MTRYEQFEGCSEQYASRIALSPIASFDVSIVQLAAAGKSVLYFDYSRRIRPL
jgi:hypothetical protein